VYKSVPTPPGKTSCNSCYYDALLVLKLSCYHDNALVFIQSINALTHPGHSPFGGITDVALACADFEVRTDSSAV
jgi:hypothetical protein